ncbi:hypothetical protein Btru_010572 [Bulinus truncatus]|nr:hypothetical protein Btru_010572 [Bulinus truncatus]
MDNKEDYLDAITAYSKNPTPEIPPILEQYLNGVAKNGETLFHWPLLKPLIVGKMEQVIAELRKGLSSENIPTRPNVENVQFDVMHKRIMESLQKFNGAPFTIQRLCELLIDPKQHYKRSDKFMRGLEKNVLVVSTVDPYGRKVVSESGNKHLVNGMDLNGSPFFPRDSNISSTLPPVPGWVTSNATLSSRHTNSTASVEEQKPSQVSPQEAPVTTNGGLASSLYNDSSEQPIAVQAEEVVEETVVTMETGDVGPVATDGGEAMADEEEEEEMGAEDTNASSTSSSSSSSEELSASDSGESTGTLPASSSDNTKDSGNRPWACLASEGENNKENIPQAVKNEDEVKTSESAPELEASLTKSEDQLVSSDAVKVQQSEGLNQSLGFDTAHSLSDSNSSEVSKQPESCDLAAGSEFLGESNSSSTSGSTSSSNLLINQLRSYADVVSGSHKDLSAEASDSPCDSVAVLERLVDSVETSTPLTSSTQSVTVPSTELDIEEPITKRFKADPDNSEHTSHQTSESSEVSALPESSIKCKTNDTKTIDTSSSSTEQTVEQSCHSVTDSSLTPHQSSEPSQCSVEKPSDDAGSQDCDTSPHHHPLK